MEDFNLPPHVQEIIDSLKEEPILTTEENKVFDFLVPILDTLIPCEAWFAKAEGDITFTRVVLYPGTEYERLVDLDKAEGEWIDIYSCEPTLWTRLLGPAIDLRILEQQNEK
jgi:hypothetical protein